MRAFSRPVELDKLEKEIRSFEIEREAIKDEKDKKTRLQELIWELEEKKKILENLKKSWENIQKEREKLRTLRDDIASLEKQADIYTQSGEYARVAEIRYGKIPEKRRYSKISKKYNIWWYSSWYWCCEYYLKMDWYSCRKTPRIRVIYICTSWGWTRKVRYRTKTCSRKSSRSSSSFKGMTLWLRKANWIISLSWSDWCWKNWDCKSSCSCIVEWSKCIYPSRYEWIYGIAFCFTPYLSSSRIYRLWWMMTTYRSSETTSIFCSSPWWSWKGTSWCLEYISPDSRWRFCNWWKMKASEHEKYYYYHDFKPYNKKWRYSRKNIRKELQKYFRVEFLNRIDDILVYDNLTEEDICSIVKLLLTSVEKRLWEKI